MIRKIIKIDEEKCDACGLCVSACHEGAIDIVEGKAKLVREHFCDGLGDCLPSCPHGAIQFEEREAPKYDEEAVKKMQRKKMKASQGCSGSSLIQFERREEREKETTRTSAEPLSRLGQWPCQIKLIPAQAPFFDGAKLLIAADCTAFAYANLHEAFMKGKITLIGCPKLDEGDYSEKLTEILSKNEIRSLTVLRMEVPCCGGIQRAAETALRNSEKLIPWQIVTVTRDGKILET